MFRWYGEIDDIVSPYGGFCGDLIVQIGEQCDNDSNECTSNCQIASVTTCATYGLNCDVSNTVVQTGTQKPICLQATSTSLARCICKVGGLVGIECRHARHLQRLLSFL